MGNHNSKTACVIVVCKQGLTNRSSINDVMAFGVKELKYKILWKQWKSLGTIKLDDAAKKYWKLSDVIYGWPLCENQAWMVLHNTSEIPTNLGH